MLLLAKGGETAFVGPVADLPPYFASLGYDCPPRTVRRRRPLPLSSADVARVQNPADFYLDVVSNDVTLHDEAMARRALATARWRAQHRNDVRAPAACSAFVVAH